MRKSYKASPDALKVVDSRQFSHGTQIANYIVDLWLPVLEYCGLGVLTILYRIASFDSFDGRPPLTLQQLARSGAMGIRRFRKILARLQTLGFIRLQLPTGQARYNHERTVIEVLDPPREVPRRYSKEIAGRVLLKDVLTLAPLPKMIDPIDPLSEPDENANGFSSEIQMGVRENPNGFSMENSNGFSMENPNGFPISFMEPKEPKEPTPTAQPAATASTVGVGVSRFDHETRKRYAIDNANFSIGRNGEHIPLGAGWVVKSSDGRYDDLIAEWLRTPKKINAVDCADCEGSGYIKKTLFEGKGAQRCTHTKLQCSK